MRTAALLLLLGGLPTFAQFDILITGGKVIDGSGGPWFYGDIGINGDSIAAVGLRGRNPHCFRQAAAAKVPSPRPCSGVTRKRHHDERQQRAQRTHPEPSQNDYNDDTARCLSSPPGGNNWHLVHVGCN
jgi:hypothetical protein